MHRLVCSLALIVILTLACGALFAAREQRGVSAARSPVASKEPNSRVIRVELEEANKEWRSTKEAAEQEVMQKACRQVAALVREVKPDSQWAPSVDFVQKRLIRRPVEAKLETLQPSVAEDVGTPHMYSASVELEIRPDAAEEIILKLRHEEARERQLALLKPMLAILALLATVAGYYRLDDVTKGYYTNWLRVSAAGALVLAVYGIRLLP